MLVTAALDAKQSGKRLSSFAQRMAESTDPWATFHETQAEPKAPLEEDPGVTAMRVLEATVNTLPKEPREHFEDIREELMYGSAKQSCATKRALAATMTAYPAEFLDASEAVGGLPPQLKSLTDFLEEESFGEAALRRESRRAADCRQKQGTAGGCGKARSSSPN